MSARNFSATVSGSFTGAGQTSDASTFYNTFSLFLFGTFVATVLLERSPDGGANYAPCSFDPNGTSATWTSSISVDVVSSNPVFLYRLRCTSYSSGTVNYVMSQGVG